MVLLRSTQLHFITLGLLQSIQGFYVPGLAPLNYKVGADVQVEVNVLVSTAQGYNQKLRSVVAYDYHEPRFHFCTDPKRIDENENLGSILFGNRITNSPFKVSFFRKKVIFSLNIGGNLK